MKDIARSRWVRRPDTRHLAAASAAVLAILLGYGDHPATAKTKAADQRLRQACQQVDLGAAKGALEDGADVNAVDENGQTGITLLRGKESKGDTFASKAQTDIRVLIAFLASKGGVEKDYLDFLLASTSPALAEQREVVQAARRDYKAFGKAKGLKRQKHREYQHEQLSENHESEHKALYEAARSPDGKLVYFRDSGRDWADWEDNGSLEEWDRKYYLKQGGVYFTLEKLASGQSQQDLTELRLYWKDGKIVLVVGKELSEFWEDMRPEAERRKLSALPNLIRNDLMKDLAKLTKQYQEEFDKSYDRVKDKLK